MTNADKIRAMSDEELIEIFARNDCFYCAYSDKTHGYCLADSSVLCEDGIKEWLKKEVE